MEITSAVFMCELLLKSNISSRHKNNNQILSHSVFLSGYQVRCFGRDISFVLHTPEISLANNSG